MQHGKRGSSGGMRLRPTISLSMSLCRPTRNSSTAVLRALAGFKAKDPPALPPLGFPKSYGKAALFTANGENTGRPPRARWPFNDLRRQLFVS